MKITRLLTSLARNTATTASNKTLAAAGDGGSLNYVIVAAYLDALEQLFISEPLPAWHSHLRSRASLRKASKRHLRDPFLAAAVLRASPKHLMGDLRAFGFLFESLTVRDFRIYAQAADSAVGHY